MSAMIDRCLNCEKPECDDCIGSSEKAVRRVAEARQTELKHKVSELELKVKRLEKDKEMLLKALEQAEQKGIRKGYVDAMAKFKIAMKNKHLKLNAMYEKGYQDGMKGAER